MGQRRAAYSHSARRRSGWRRHDQAHDDADVQAGDGEQVGEARIAVGGAVGLGDGAAGAGEHGGGDGAARAGDGGRGCARPCGRARTATTAAGRSAGRCRAIVSGERAMPLPAVPAKKASLLRRRGRRERTGAPGGRIRARTRTVSPALGGGGVVRRVGGGGPCGRAAGSAPRRAASSVTRRPSGRVSRPRTVPSTRVARASGSRRAAGRGGWPPAPPRTPRAAMRRARPAARGHGAAPAEDRQRKRQGGSRRAGGGPPGGLGSPGEVEQDAGAEADGEPEGEPAALGVHPGVEERRRAQGRGEARPVGARRVQGLHNREV